MTGPIWQQIRQSLADEIGEGRFGPGDRLPTEASLAQRFGVNRHTVRRALGALQGEGVVHARRGSGVFVTHRPVPYRLGPRVSFTQNMAETGHTGTREIVRLETLPALEEEAGHLGLSPGDPVHVVESVASIDGVPSTHSRAFLPAARLPGFPDAMRAEHSITRALAACGVPGYARAWTRVSATRAEGATARHLGVAEGAPVLRTIALNHAEAGWPVEYAVSAFSGDRVEFLIEGQSSP